MARPATNEMGIGRGRFRKALRGVLLSRRTPPGLQDLVAAELGWACVYCGVSGQHDRLQLDHLWPEATGGCAVPGNVVPACPTCNSDRYDQPWEVFLRTSPRVTKARTAAEIERQVCCIRDYMNRHGQSGPPCLNDVFTKSEQQLLADFDLLLSAISDGALARAGRQKKANVRFACPEDLFDDLVRVARSHLIDNVDN